MTGQTLLLTGEDIRALLPVADCVAAVEAAFRIGAESGAAPPGVLGMASGTGGFHVKAAGLELDRSYFAAKLNANFPENPARWGLPTIQGIVALCDGSNGALLALMDSIEITRIRTGAATAVAAKYLARPDSTTLTLFGCGRQSWAQVECLRVVLPIARVFAYDPEGAASASLVRRARERWGIEAEAAGASAVASRAARSDVIVTCTPSRTAFLSRHQVRPGTFIAAVGADGAGKQELEPALLAASLLVTDVRDQCARIGELHHALAAGAMQLAEVHAELGDLVTGRKPGRTTAEEITVFDSTGTALEDVAAAALVYERAVTCGRGTPLRFAAASEAGAAAP